MNFVQALKHYLSLCNQRANHNGNQVGYLMVEQLNRYNCWIHSLCKFIHKSRCPWIWSYSRQTRSKDKKIRKTKNKDYPSHFVRKESGNCHSNIPIYFESGSRRDPEMDSSQEQAKLPGQVLRPLSSCLQAPKDCTLQWSRDSGHWILSWPCWGQLGFFHSRKKIRSFGWESAILSGDIAPE